MKSTPLLMCGEMVRATLEDSKTQTRRALTKMLVDVPRQVRGVMGYGTLAPGRHKAVMNKLGAVSCDLGNGKMLGLKPGEFNWVCPYAEGVTECTKSGWVIHPKESTLWVKGTHAFHDDKAKREQDLALTYYRADDPKAYDSDGPWRPSIFMPRWASRISLAVVSVRIQRVQAISEEDALAEGVNPPRCPRCGYTLWDCKNIGDHHLCPNQHPKSAIDAYQALWDSINAERAEGKYAWAVNPWAWAITFKRL